jgi:fibronectin type 3 domain-containing protein
MRRFIPKVSISVMVLLLACGKSGVSVAISPESPTVAPAATQQFQAKVSGASDTSVTWSVSEANGGTINGDGLYTAPLAQGTYHPVATSVADPTKSATATVAVVPNTVPPAPTGVTATGQFRKVTVSWATTTGASGYHLLRSATSGGPYSPIQSGVTTGAVDTGLGDSTTYFYVVTAENSVGVSAPSPEVTATTAPAPPAGVVATGGPASISLSWAASAQASSYTIWRSTTAGGPYDAVGTSSSAPFVDSSVFAGTLYYYVVRAGQAGEESGNSDEASAVTAPAAPANVSATGGIARVTVSWTAATTAQSYVVQRSSAAGGPYAVVGSPQATSFSDTGLGNATAYFYVVLAVNGSGTSPQSQEASTSTAPSAPSALTATGSDGQIALSWPAPTGATSYALSRATADGGPYALLGASATTAFNDASLAPNATFFYVVQARIGSAISGFSPQASATTAPGAPTGLTASGTTRQVNLAWTGVPSATSYVAGRATSSGGPYIPLAETSALQLIDSGLTDGTTYFYVVRAKSASGLGAASAEVSCLTLPAAPVVTGSGGPGQVSLSWAAVNTAGSYQVMRAIKSGGPYVTAGIPTAPAFVDSGLGGTVQYFYVVHAVNASGVGAASAEASGIATPTEFVVNNADVQQILRFDRNANGDVSPAGRFGWVTKAVDPFQIALVPQSQEVAVLDLATNSVRFFSLNQTGNVGPTHLIQGNQTLLASPRGLAFDPVHGETFVSNIDASVKAILVFSAPNTNVAPVRQISGTATGFGFSLASLAIDSVNDELIVNNGVDVRVFSRAAVGNVAPLRVISGVATGISASGGILSIAVDPANDEIFVANNTDGSNLPDVNVFARTANGNVAPLRSFHSTFQRPTGLAVDSVHDELLMSASDQNQFLTFARTASGSVTPTRQIMAPGHSAWGIAYNPATDRVTIPFRGTGEVATFSRTATIDPPFSDITGAGMGMLNARVVALDPVHNEICVANGFLPSACYARTAELFTAAPVRTFGEFNGFPIAIAVDPKNDELYTLFRGNISVYPRTEDGSRQLAVRAIFGASTTLSFATGLAVDAIHDEIFVTDGNTSSVLVFNRSGNGNVAPVRTIAGASTGLINPEAIQYDSIADQLVVANGDSAFLFFPRTASGNVAPLRTELITHGSAFALDASNQELIVPGFQPGFQKVSVYSSTATGTPTPLRTIGGPFFADLGSSLFVGVW